MASSAGGVRLRSLRAAGFVTLAAACGGAAASAPQPDPQPTNVATATSIATTTATATATTTASAIATATTTTTTTATATTAATARPSRLPPAIDRIAGGQVAVVVFWATWSEPSKKLLPEMQKLASAFAARGVVVVGVSEDDEDDGVATFAKANGVRFPIVFDGDKSIAQALVLKTMPAVFLFDRAGAPRFKHNGYHDGMDADVKRELEQLVAP